MSTQYHYLIASLPDIALEDNKLSYTVADFKEEMYSQLSEKDKKVIDLFFLKYDNANVLKLLVKKDAVIDQRGSFSADELNEYIALIREGGQPSPQSFPTYLTDFIATYNMAEEGERHSLENELEVLYYAYAMKGANGFVSSWFKFNLTINNILTSLIGRKYKIDVSSQILGDNEVAETLRTSSARDFGLTGEVEFLDKLLKISEIDELFEREKRLDMLKWNRIEEETFFHYFTVERAFAFLLKLEMIERWVSLDGQTGRQLFRDMIDTLKNGANIPPEFRK